MMTRYGWAGGCLLNPFGGGDSSSSSSQSATNQQVGLQGSGVALGAGSQNQGSIKTNSVASGNTISAPINISTTTTLDEQALETAGGLITNLGGQALTLGAGAVTANKQIANAAIVSSADQAAYAEDIVGGIAGSAINAGAQAVGQAFQFAQNQTALNYDALNQNTALAFSTINALDTAGAAGAVSAAAQDTLAAAQAATAAGSGAPTAIYTGGGSQPYTGGSGIGGISTGTLLLIAAAIAALIFGPKLLKS